MKKIFIIMTLIICYNFLKYEAITLAGSSIMSDLYRGEDGGTFYKSCDLSFCGLKINPQTTNNTYSFFYNNSSSIGLYNKGVYQLNINTNFKNSFIYRKMIVISKNGQKEYDVSKNNLSINLIIESYEDFYLKFENKVSSLLYFSDGSTFFDIFYYFSLKRIDVSETTFIKEKVHGNMYSVINHSSSIFLNPSSQNNYLYQIYADESENKFKAGTYDFGFYHELNSCYEYCNSFQYQKIRLIGQNKTNEYLVNYYGHSKFQIQISHDEDFYLEIDNKVNIIGDSEYPLDIFKNIYLKNTSKNNIFISYVDGGFNYSVDNVDKNIFIDPNEDFRYKFVVTNGIPNKKFKAGIYRLQFEHNLNACGNNCQSYLFQNISIITLNSNKEINVTYSGKNQFSLDFSAKDYFYLLFENRLDVIRNDDYPIDSFKNIKLTLLSPLIDQLEPVFNNFHEIYLSDIDNPIDVQTIKSQIKAYDENDGELTSSIVIKQDYFSDNKHKLGTYNLIFSVTDKNFNESILTISIKVVDITPPIIEGENILYCSISQKCLKDDEVLTINDISKLFIISDNVDTITKYTILEDNWSNVSKHICQYYYIVAIRAEDLSANYSNIFKIKIIYYDDIEPSLISGEDFYTSTNILLKIDIIKKHILIKDNFDLTSDILVKEGVDYLYLEEDYYTTNYLHSGIYSIVFSFYDFLFIINIHVIEDLPPLFYTDGNILFVDSNYRINSEMLINVLKIIKKIDDNYLSINTIIDEYSTSQNKEGTFNLSYKVSYEDKEETINFQIISYNNQINEIKEANNKPIILIIFLTIIVFLISIYVIIKIKKTSK